MNENDVLVMAQTLWGEARGETDEGMIAVACTIINRFKSKRWFAGATLAATCLKPWQYSCWNAKDPNRPKMLKLTYVELKREIAIIRGLWEDWQDITKGATHYYNPKACKKPAWAVGKAPCVVIGDHLFFNNID